MFWRSDGQKKIIFKNNKFLYGGLQRGQKNLIFKNNYFLDTAGKPKKMIFKNKIKQKYLIFKNNYSL